MAMGPTRTGGWSFHLPRPWRAGRLVVLALLVNLGVVVLVLSTRLGFAPSATAAPAGAPPGFLRGRWHGLVLPIAVMVSFFRPSVGLYAGVHDGHAYDVGFLLGVFVILHWPFARVTRTVHHHHPEHVVEPGQTPPYGAPAWPHPPSRPNGPSA